MQTLFYSSLIISALILYFVAYSLAGHARESGIMFSVYLLICLIANGIFLDSSIKLQEKDLKLAFTLFVVYDITLFMMFTIMFLTKFFNQNWQDYAEDLLIICFAIFTLLLTFLKMLFKFFKLNNLS